MNTPSYTIREERLRAKPLDWNATIGKPTPHQPSSEKGPDAATTTPGLSAGGKPNPNAEREARRLHPNDWK